MDAQQPYRFPAFFSYASKDNNYFSSIIDKFHSQFSKILSGALMGDTQLDCEPFLDTRDMPTNGNLTQLILDNVRASFALFIFVGPNYVRSEWCLQELTEFSRMQRGAQDVLSKRVWMFKLGELE